MAIFTYSFDLDSTLKSVFITDDVTGTTIVEVRNKTTNALVVSASLTLWQTMIRNVAEWQTLRTANDLISFSKI